MMSWRSSWVCRLPCKLQKNFVRAENVAIEFKIERETQDRMALCTMRHGVGQGVAAFLCCFFHKWEN